MKTIKQLSKILTICALIFSLNANSQTSNNEKSKYVRVYNLEGQKINKGRVVYTNDSILGLKKGTKFIEVNIKNIGEIKTKGSVGKSVLTASLIGGKAGALIGAATSQEQTKTADGGWLFGEYQYTTGTSSGTGAAIGGGAGLLGGALIGLGSSLFKNSETFIINGDKEKWELIRKNLK